MAGKFLRSSLNYILDWHRLPSRRRGRAGWPTILNLPITDNCNSRCVMCDVWKNDSRNEMTVDELRQVLSDPLFGRIEHVGISGGEPTLRADLIELIKAVLGELDCLKSLSITSHGFHVARWKRLLPELSRLCAERGINFTLNLSLDGIGEVHDTVRGIPGGYQRVLSTYQCAREHGVNVTFQTTVSRPNVFGVGRVLHFAETMGAEVDFRAATDIARLKNKISMREVALLPAERSFFADFLTSSNVLRATPSPARRLFYQNLARQLTRGAPRRAPCFYQREGVLLDPHGNLFHCSISEEVLGNTLQTSAAEIYFSEANEAHRKHLLANTCPVCVHDQSGAWTPAQLILETLFRRPAGQALLKIADLAMVTLSALPSILSLLVASRKPASLADTRLKNILVVGMYGGEHVGDSAILGGVLQRVRNQYGTEHAAVASLRPDRTRRWIESLGLDVKTRAISYDDVQTYLDHADAVVLAGGPVMDLIGILTRQLKIIHRARQLNKPVIIEGVGVGPFKSALGRWLARLLFKSADKITVRSLESQTHPLVANLHPEINMDPAFDYLASRASRLPVPVSPSPGESTPSPHPAEAFHVGINLRPLWNKYAEGNLLSRELERVFLLKFAESLATYRLESSIPVHYHFFPMNADQYGFSDLGMAYRLHDLLPTGFPLRVWEAEPGVDELLPFLRGMDVVIAMRFHAAIFAYSQNVPVLGIDYSLGKPGKVSSLFRERGEADRVCRVDTFTGQWLASRLAMISSAA